MSFTATKPSALWTCSPSATSLQKRQSGCDTDHPFCTDVDRASTDEPADGGLDEPRRIVVSVPFPRPVYENEVGRADLLAPPAPARCHRGRAQSRAPFLFHGRRHAVLVGSGRPGPG